MHRPWRLLILTALLLPLFLGRPGAADEGKPDEPPAGGPGDGDEPLDDGADVKVSFGEEINRALDKGTRWLLAKPDLFVSGGEQMAHWGLIKGTTFYGGQEGHAYRHPAGPTALALYTLLKCGVDPKHPVIEKGFNWLLKEHFLSEQYDDLAPSAVGYPWNYRIALGSYELSAEILALCAKYDHFKRTRNTDERRRRGKLVIKDRTDRKWLEELVDALISRRGVPADSPAREDRLGWRYNVPNTTFQKGNQRTTLNTSVGHISNQDLSSTQLAALALFAAQQFGFSAPMDVWFDIVDFTLSHQEEDGPEHERYDPIYKAGGYAAPKDKARGFMYIKGSPDRSEGKATGSMTACGLCILLLAKDVITKDNKGKRTWEERKLDSQVDRAIWDSLAWLDRNWSSFRNPFSQTGYHIYYLYALERAMDILNKNLVGQHNWYAEGARAILDRQKPARAKDLLDDRAPEVDVTFWETGDTHEPKDVLDTCFALLFLKRATKGLVPGGVAVTGGDEAPVDNR